MSCARSTLLQVRQRGDLIYECDGTLGRAVHAHGNGQRLSNDRIGRYALVSEWIMSHLLAMRLLSGMTVKFAKKSSRLVGKEPLRSPERMLAPSVIVINGSI